MDTGHTLPNATGPLNCHVSAFRTGVAAPVKTGLDAPLETIDMDGGDRGDQPLNLHAAVMHHGVALRAAQGAYPAGPAK